MMKPWQNSFDNSMKQSRRQFNIVWNLALGFIVLVFIAVAASWIFGGFVVYKTANAVSTEGGIKPVLEKLWCGQPGCLGK